MTTTDPDTPIERPRGLDTSYYTDPEIFRTELDRIFARTWQLVGHRSQVERPGRFLTARVGDQHVIVANDHGTVKGFYNVCQHRGHELLPPPADDPMALAGAGEAQTITCPYHAWTYDLGGRLLHARGEQVGELCVPAVRVESLAGFLFVNLDADAPALAEHAPGVERALLELAPDAPTRVLSHRRTHEIRANWKIAVENYNECYHCPNVHRAFSAGVVSPASYRITPRGNVIHHTARGPSADNAAYERANDANDYGSFFVWPISSIQCYPGHVLNTFRWTPVDPERTILLREWWFDGTEPSTEQRQLIETRLDHDGDRRLCADGLGPARCAEPGVSSRTAHHRSQRHRHHSLRGHGAPPASTAAGRAGRLSVTRGPSSPWPDTADGASAALAEFLASLTGRVAERRADLPAKAADAVLDTLGCIVFGARWPWTVAAHRHALATGGDGPCPVIGTGRSTTPAMAAFANGAAAHAFELDDVHEEAISHPGAVVVPAAIAVAAEVGSTAADLLEAVVIGYEAMGRAGLGVGPAAHMLAGFHPTSMSGVFGSAAAAGRLLGFDGEALNHAFGVAVSLASGTMEFAASGGMAKRMHAGRAAEGGILAALLVADGFEGAADGLAGTYGFCNVFTERPDIAALTDRLGERWMIDEITVKPYAACSDIHPMIQAASELTAEHGLTADRIVAIEAEGPTKAATQNSMDGTVSVMAAQYSAQFNIAAAILADPGDPATYGPERIGDPALADLQARVRAVEPAAEFDETYAWKMGGRVTVHLDDGRTLSRTVHGQKGSMHAPLSPDELDGKFSLLVGPTAASLRDAVRRLAFDGSAAAVADLIAVLNDVEPAR